MAKKRTTKKWTIPYPITEALGEVTRLLGMPNLIGCPGEIRLSEQPLPAEDVYNDGAYWPIRVDIWRPGLYLRAFCAGVVDTNYGDQVGLVGARLRLNDGHEVRNVWDAIAEKWDRQKKFAETIHRPDEAPDEELVCGSWCDGPDRPIRCASLKEWRREGGELWITRARVVPEVWRDSLPTELSRLIGGKPGISCKMEIIPEKTW